MNTAVINYRVADFLKQHAPFQSVEENDLLALVEHGRVKFHEVDEYVYWQGNPHGPFIYVIQQGAVSLWEEGAEGERLRDIRGVGDLLGVDQFLGSESYLHSAKTTSDVVLYALQGSDFNQMLAKYPHAERYLASHSAVNPDYQPLDRRRAAHEVFFCDIVQSRFPLTCSPQESIRGAARLMNETGRRAMAAIDTESRARSIVTPERILEWTARGEDFSLALEAVADGEPCTVAPQATISECVLAMADAGAEVVAVTENGSPSGRLHALITGHDLAPAFLDQPLEILRAIGHAPGTDSLRWLHRRARAFLLEHLTTPSSIDWLARFAHRIDVNILRRVIHLTEADAESCWCFYGASGRLESLAPVVPQIAVIIQDGGGQKSTGAGFLRVLNGLEECGYVKQAGEQFDSSTACVTLEEWQDRFLGWVAHPVQRKLYHARPLFDLRPVHGTGYFWQQLRSAAGTAVHADKGFVQVLAHDCMASLPPITFFRDLVIEEAGERTDVFHLEKSVLRPLVDVGRVYGIAAGRPLSGTSVERFGLARMLLPAHESIFREAAEALRVALFHQSKAGIRENGDGSELSPTLLSRYDRQTLKSCFRTIHRLLELTAECPWREAT